MEQQEPFESAPAYEKMTLGQTLVGIFLEPGRTFAALRWKPRFLIAAIISIVAFSSFQIAFYQKMGYETVVRQQMESSPQAAQMSSEQKTKALELYQNPAMRAFVYAAPIIFLIITFLIGALIYWGASSAFGGEAGFLKSLSIYVYSSFPYYLLFLLLNIVVLMLKSADEIDPVRGQRGVIQTNLAFLVDPKTSPAVSTALSCFDLLWFYGLFLAAIGFQKIARLSASSALTVVIIFWVVIFAIRMAVSLAFGVAS